MSNHQDPPKDPRKKQQPGIPDNKSNEREGGDDVLQSSPTDNRLDEKVIVNEQRSDKIVNTPAQAAANDSESTGNDEEIINR